MLNALLAVAAVSVAVGAPQDPPPADTLLTINVKRREQLHFFHPITSDSAERFATLIVPEDWVVLSSPGGDGVGALRMSRDIRSNRAMVEVGGRCTGECALVWASADYHLSNDFVPVLFDGTTVFKRERLTRFADVLSVKERGTEAESVAALETLPQEFGLAVWLEDCAYRLRNVRIERYPEGFPVMLADLDQRLIVSDDYDEVWFPREILMAAGVRGLPIYDRPTQAQKDRLSGRDPARGATGRPIYWAEDGDCDPERAAAGA